MMNLMKDYPEDVEIVESASVYFAELCKVPALRPLLLTKGVSEPLMAAFHTFRDRIGGAEDFNLCAATIVRYSREALAALLG